MKKSQFKGKLGLEKIQIAKLNNLSIIRGGSVLNTTNNNPSITIFNDDTCSTSDKWTMNTCRNA